MAATDTSGENGTAEDEDAADDKTPKQDVDESSATGRGWLGAQAARLRNKYVLGGLVLALLAVAAGAGTLFVFTDVFNDDGIPPEPIITLKRIESLESDYVEVSPLIARIQTEDGKAKNLVFVIDLEVDNDAGTVDLVKQSMPRLRDSFVLALHVPPLRGVDLWDSKMVEEARSRLLAASAESLGKNVVRAIIIRDIK